MGDSMKISFDVTKKEFDYICQCAHEKNLTIAEYVVMCVLAYDNYLYLGTLINQLRCIKYQIKTITDMASEESQNELLEAQKNAYNSAINALRALRLNS